MLNVGEICKMMGVLVYCLQLLVLMLLVDIVDSAQPFGDRPPLLLMTKNGISLLDEGTWQEHVLYTQQHEYSYFTSNDIHYKKSLLFWTEYIWNEDTYNYRYETRSAKLSNGVLDPITTLSSSECGIAVDWIEDKYYTLDIIEKDEKMTGYIQVANLDGSDRKDVLRVENMKATFCEIQIDPLNRWIYFVSFKVFERVRMNGQNREVIDSTTCNKQGYCDLLFAVDHTRGRVFWMDYFSSQINSMSADGKDRRSHDFIDYYKTITMQYSGKTFQTLDKSMRYAYKNSVYSTVYFDENPEAKNTIYRLDTQNVTITPLHVGIKVEEMKIYHQSAQPSAATG